MRASAGRTISPRAEIVPTTGPKKLGTVPLEIAEFRPYDADPHSSPRPPRARRHAGRCPYGAGLEFRYVDLFEGGAATARLDLQSVPGLVVMGGPMNVDETERYPFLAAEVDWIRRALDLRLPMLGICLGAQLLAKALGAKVFPNRVKEIGWYSIETDAGGGGRSAVCRLRQSDHRLSMAWRHLRLASRGGPPGAKPLVRSAGVSGRPLRLRPAVPRRDDRRDDRRLAGRAGQLRRVGQIGLHRSRGHPGGNAPAAAGVASAGAAGAWPLCRPVPLEGVTQWPGEPFGATAGLSSSAEPTLAATLLDKPGTGRSLVVAPSDLTSTLT